MKTKRFGWMIGLAAVVLAVAGSVFSGASAAQWIPDSSEDGTWRVYVSHDLNGGHWDAVSIDPHVLTALRGQNMPADGLDQEKRIEPIKENASFRGWSVRFTNPETGDVLYDSGDEVWNLDHPFDYYPGNPLEMDCLMTARWVVDMPLPNPVGRVVDMLPPIPARRGVDMPSPNPVGRDGDMLLSDSDDCTRFTMVEHVTVPPGTIMKPNQNFRKIWRVRNDSTCTWTPEFYWEFDGGYDSDAPWKTYIPYNVDPGETVDIVMDMNALYYEGEFWGNWILAYPGLYWEFTPVNERKYISYNYIVEGVQDQPPAVTPMPDSDDCTRFTMVEHVTVPPGTIMKPNQNFRKIWRVRNDSTCTWTPEFYWEFDGGYDSDAPWKTYIPYNVDPGETVDIVMDMNALYYEGEFWGNWILAYPGLYWEFTPVNERKYISYNYIVKEFQDQDWFPEINDTSLTVIDKDLLNLDLPDFFPEPTIAWPPVIR